MSVRVIYLFCPKFDLGWGLYRIMLIHLIALVLPKLCTRIRISRINIVILILFHYYPQLFILYASIQDISNMCAKWHSAKFRDYGKLHHNRWWNKRVNVFTCTNTHFYSWRIRTPYVAQMYYDCVLLKTVCYFSSIQGEKDSGSLFRLSLKTIKF